MAMSIPGENMSRKVPKTYLCSRCLNHELAIPVKGHYRTCPFRFCTCEKCNMVKNRQDIMAAQASLRKAQKRVMDEGSRRDVHRFEPVENSTKFIAERKDAPNHQDKTDSYWMASLFPEIQRYPALPCKENNCYKDKSSCNGTESKFWETTRSNENSLHEKSPNIAKNATGANTKIIEKKLKASIVQQRKEIGEPAFYDEYQKVDENPAFSAQDCSFTDKKKPTHHCACNVGDSPIFAHMLFQRELLVLAHFFPDCPISYLESQLKKSGGNLLLASESLIDQYQAGGRNMLTFRYGNTRKRNREAYTYEGTKESNSIFSDRCFLFDSIAEHAFIDPIPYVRSNALDTRNYSSPNTLSIIPTLPMEYRRNTTPMQNIRSHCTENCVNSTACSQYQISILPLSNQGVNSTSCANNCLRTPVTPANQGLVQSPSEQTQMTKNKMDTGSDLLTALSFFPDEISAALRSYNLEDSTDMLECI